MKAYNAQKSVFFLSQKGVFLGVFDKCTVYSNFPTVGKFFIIPLETTKN